MTFDDCQFVAGAVRAATGVLLDPERHYLFQSRLAPVARTEGLASVRDLIAQARARRDPRLYNTLVEAMLQCDTSFFRHPRLFATFEAVLDEQAETVVVGQPLRILSVGCGSGQEAVSLAILAHKHSGGASRWSWEVTAADVSEQSVARVGECLYSQFEVQRGLPIRALLDHFEQVPEGFRVKSALRERIRPKVFNALDEPDESASYDLIVCADLLAILDPKAQPLAARRLADALCPGGRLLTNDATILERCPEALLPVEGTPGTFRRSPLLRSASMKAAA